MAIAFGYVPATNIVTVTGGTAAIPATFADFVVADRAGTYTIMDAIATAMNLVLDRLIRPVEFRALQITFTLAGTNAGAGDTVDITGTDAWDNAQNESINVAAGNGAYVSAKYWRTITDIDCTGFADGVGTIDAVQGQWGVIWDYGSRQYRVDSHFDIGDAGTPTYFKCVESIVFAATALMLRVTDVATWKCGEVSSDEPSDTSWINILDLKYEHTNVVMNGGTLLAYGTTIIWNNPGQNYTHFYIAGDATFKRCKIFGLANYGGVHWTSTSDVTIDDVYYHTAGRNVLRATPTIVPNDWKIDQYHIDGYIDALDCNIVARNVNVFNPNGRTLYQNSFSDTQWIDCNDNLFSQVNTNPAKASSAYRKYSCNIHIADKDGADLVGVVVDCEDQFGNPAWAAGTVTTNANGDIAEQQIIYRRYYYDIGDQTTTYSPHIFTISKAGYETQVLDEITVDHPIVWHEELLPELAEGDVRDGVAYGEDSEGNLELPGVGDVEDGVGFGSDGVEFTGTFGVPLEDDVEGGVGYGAGGIEFEGDLEIPIIGDVRDGIGYGADDIELVGVLDLPSIADVKLHVVFDSGTKTGTYICPIPAGELIAYLEESTNLVAYLEESVDLVGEILI